MKRLFPLIAVIVAFYATAILWIITDSRAAKHTFDESSAANTSDNGASLAFAYLRRNRHVEMLHHLVTSDNVAKNGVVFRIGRAIEPDFLEEQEEKSSAKKEKTPRKHRANPLLTADEAEWVERGGRIVLAIPSDIGPLKFRNDTEAAAQKVFPFAPGIERIALPWRRGIATSTLRPRLS